MAGLLDGRRATTHWAGAREFARRFPAVTVGSDRIFVRDGGLFTSAGVTAGIDLALAFVEEDHGSDVGRKAARWLVLFLQRSGGQSQFSQRLSVPVSAGSPIRAVVDAIVAEPAGDHRMQALARRAGLSERHLARVSATRPARRPGGSWSTSGSKRRGTSSSGAICRWRRWPSDAGSAAPGRCGGRSVASLRSVRWSTARFRTAEPLVADGIAV